MDWHKRYVQQAGWTSELRNYLFKRAGLSGARRVLEVGCGSGPSFPAWLPAQPSTDWIGSLIAWPRRTDMLRRQTWPVQMRCISRMAAVFSILLFAISCFCGLGTRCKPCAK